MTKKPKKIMIIDDDQSMLFLSKAIIASAGFEVITEADSTRAYLTVKAQKPDLILMDLVMPEINGIELAKQIEEDAELKNVHIFAITGTPVLNEHNEKFFEKVILKPYHMEDLLKEIQGFFAKKK